MDISRRAPGQVRGWQRALGRTLRRTFLRPQMVAFLPGLLLAGYWFGGQGVLMIIALTFPLLLVLGGLFDNEPRPVDGLTGHLTREALLESIDDALFSIRSEAETAIVVAFELDGAQQLARRIGPSAMETVLCRTADRLAGAVRAGDRVARIGEHRYALLFAPVRNAGMDLALRTVERLQGAASEPISINAGSVYVTLSAGFCLERRAVRRSGEALLEGAVTALEEAKLVGEGAVRAFSAEMRSRATHRQALAEDIGRAIEEGEIVPWFQPQVDARTGTVTGMEALARWNHPKSGIVAPADFIPTAEAGGLSERLGEAMLFHSLSALRRWDRAGLAVPRIGVNFSSTELRNPRLVDRVKWELDRFDLAPERLSVEILETVVADTGDDTVSANIAGLATLGCAIDLDDFGTGAASIAAIRRFAVSRIKIDRSFVTRIDADPAQRKMVAAILSMADKLELDTLAEGVETRAEHALLAEMGCGHVQGFLLARPMPPEEAERWLKSYVAGLEGAVSPVDDRSGEGPRGAGLGGSRGVSA
jgi:diguanylate cyclase (GGDEF)-like protein